MSRLPLGDEITDQVPVRVIRRNLTASTEEEIAGALAFFEGVGERQKLDEALQRKCAERIAQALEREDAAKDWIAAAVFSWIGIAAVSALGLLGSSAIAKTGALPPLILAGALCVAASGYLCWLADLRRCRA